MMLRSAVADHVIVIYGRPAKTKIFIEIYVDGAMEFNGWVNNEDIGGDNAAESWCVNHGYFEEWQKFLTEQSDSLGSILASVSRVIYYDHQFALDIFIGDDVFRCDKDGFLNPKPFLIWYMGTSHRIPIIPEGQWGEFVTSLISIAEVRKDDPLAPDLLGTLMGYLRSSPIHSDFCDSLAAMAMGGGESAWFVYRKDEDFALYVPSHVMQDIRKKSGMGTKAFRNFWAPYLKIRERDVAHRMGTSIPFDRRIMKKFWVLDMEKLTEQEVSLAGILENVINCEEEKEEEISYAEK
jgi:hypothetical protein